MRLMQQKTIVDWDENRIGRFNLVKGIYLVGSILVHSWLGFVNVSMQDPAHSKFITLLDCFMRMADMGSYTLMMLCGYDFRKRSILSTFRNQIRKLRRPYLLTTLAITIGVTVLCFLSGAPIWAELRRKALPFLMAKVEWNDSVGFPMNNVGPMWFIVVYVMGSVLLNAVLKLKNEGVQSVAVVALYLCGTCGVPSRYLRFVPFGLQRSLNYLPFLYCGYLMKKHRFFDSRSPVWLAWLTVLICLLCIYEDRKDMPACLLCGMTMFVLLLRVSRLRTFAGLEWMGRNITTFCCFNTFTYVVLPWSTLDAYFAQKPWLSGLIAFVAYSTICIGGCIVVNRIKYASRRKNQMRVM